jgi:hypothetical protein
MPRFRPYAGTRRRHTPGSLAAHRYHYPGRAADLPVGVRKAPGGALALTHEGQDMSPEDLVLRLLESYTKELVTD